MIQWYYRDPESRRVGPLSPEEFEECVATGEVRARTRVWRSGLADWTTYAALLAQEAHRGAVSARIDYAPISTSYSTFVALGISVVNRHSHRSARATPMASPRHRPGTTLESCPQCRKQMPSHLFREFSRRRLCGSCRHRSQLKAERDKLREAAGADATWLGKRLVRMALVAAIVAAIRFFCIELSGSGHPANEAAKPAPEDLTASAVAPIIQFASAKP